MYCALIIFYCECTIKGDRTFYWDLNVCQCIVIPQERIMMQNYPVRNQKHTTSPLLHCAVRLKKQMAGLTVPISTKIPAAIKQAAFTPSQCHQRIRSYQRPPFTPLLALTNTQSAALPPISLKLSYTPPSHTNQRKNQHTIVMSELRADHLNPLLCNFKQRLPQVKKHFYSVRLIIETDVRLML